MFLRYLHEMFPVRFLDGRFMMLISFSPLEQMNKPLVWNNEELNPETDWKAFDIRFWFSMLHGDDGSARVINNRRFIKNM